MANAPVAPAASSGPRLRDRGGIFLRVAQVDGAIYGVERIAVTAALLVMTGVYGLAILYQFLQKLRSVWLDPATPNTELWPAPVLLVAMFLVGRAMGQNTPGLRNAPSLANVVGIVGAAASVVLSVALLTLPSSVMCAVLCLVIGIVVAVEQLKTPHAIGTPGLPLTLKVRVALAVAGTGGGVWLSLLLPEGYSWAQKISLVQLLWVAFVGASMAAFEGRHLTVDAVRKAVPARFAPWYNALSLTVAAVFTALFAWLAWIYFQRRLVETPTPGEIPDWVKVFAIPFALGMVTLRFAGQAVAQALHGALIGGAKGPDPASAQVEAGR